jgi:hypothetical protein
MESLGMVSVDCLVWSLLFEGSYTTIYIRSRYLRLKEHGRM